MNSPLLLPPQVGDDVASLLARMANGTPNFAVGASVSVFPWNTYSSVTTSTAFSTRGRGMLTFRIAGSTSTNYSLQMFTQMSGYDQMLIMATMNMSGTSGQGYFYVGEDCFAPVYGGSNANNMFIASAAVRIVNPIYFKLGNASTSVQFQADWWPLGL